jgi:hypothetical protein
MPALRRLAACLIPAMLAPPALADDACRAVNPITALAVAGDFATAHRRTIMEVQDRYRAGLEDDYLLDSVLLPFNRERQSCLDPHFDAWVAAMPSSYAASLARASHYRGMAGATMDGRALPHRRGHGGGLHDPAARG